MKKGIEIMVAKSYQDLKQISEPFAEGNKMYVLVDKGGTSKKVRWYSVDEYNRMYPDTPAPRKKIRSTKFILGFEQGYITIFKGNTDPFDDWFREHKAVYRTFWGWAFETGTEIPEKIPAGLEPIQLSWELVADVDRDELKPQHEIDIVLDSLRYDESPSEFQGKIGDRITIDVVVKQAIQMDGYYSPTTFHVFEDKEGNQYTWNTSAKNLPVGNNYTIKGSVKNFCTYHNIKQTVLTRCSIC